MKPCDFPESNTTFNAPSDMDESQVYSIKAYAGQVRGGNLDGSIEVIVAWLPNAEERAEIAKGKPIFLSCLGGLPPHHIETSFKSALNK